MGKAIGPIRLIVLLLRNISYRCLPRTDGAFPTKPQLLIHPFKISYSFRKISLCGFRLVYCFAVAHEGYIAFTPAEFARIVVYSRAWVSYPRKPHAKHHPSLPSTFLLPSFTTTTKSSQIKPNQTKSPPHPTNRIPPN